MLELTQLAQVTQKLLTYLEQGKHEMQSIVEIVRKEREDILTKLVDMKAEMIASITALDRLEKEEQLTRYLIMDINEQPDRFSQKDAWQTYEEVRNIQSQLKALREQNLAQCQQREQLEGVLRQVSETLSMAEKMESQAGLAMQLFTGGLQGVAVKFDELQLRQQLSVRVIKAQEEERQRVAREIHDGPAQSMANVVLRAEICEKLMLVDPGSVRRELHELKEMVKESLQEVRKIIFDLRPMILDDLGIIPTLKRFITELQKRTEMSIELIVLGGENQRFPSVLEVAIFRIVQEALNNIYKHAQARRCVIKLGVMLGRVNISITDDGCGFDTSGVMKNVEIDCFGLLGMRERVELLDGQLRISSVAKKGSEIHVSIPVRGETCAGGENQSLNHR